MRATSFSWLRFFRPREDKTPAALGGIVTLYTAAAALNTGDCVFISAANTVNKSGTAADYAGFVGVVVGGAATNFNIPGKVGVPATTGSGQGVLVQISGIAEVVAGGTVTVGTHFTVGPDTSTAGRVVASTTAGQVIGKTVTTGASAATMKIQISPR